MPMSAHEAVHKLKNTICMAFCWKIGRPNPLARPPHKSRAQDLPHDLDWSHAMLGSLQGVVKKAAQVNFFRPDPVVSWKATPSKADFERLLDLWIKGQSTS